MSDPAGILLHLQLIEASHEFTEVLLHPDRIPGYPDRAKVMPELTRRATAYSEAYNASLRWAKKVGKQLEASGG